MSKLTPRELEVAKTIISGLTYKQAAQKLGVTTGTVEEHCQSVRRKLGANSKAQVIYALTKAGLI